MEVFLRSGGPSWRALGVVLGKSRGYLGRVAAHEALKKYERSSEEVAEKVPRDFY